MNESYINQLRFLSLTLSTKARPVSIDVFFQSYNAYIAAYVFLSSCGSKEAEFILSLKAVLDEYSVLLSDSFNKEELFETMNNTVASLIENEIASETELEAGEQLAQLSPCNSPVHDGVELPTINQALQNQKEATSGHLHQKRVNNQNNLMWLHYSGHKN